MSKINENKTEVLVREVYEDIKDIFSDYNVDVSFKHSGCVSVKGREIIINNPSAFADIVSRADNFEVYSQIDGIIVLNIGFNGLN